MPKKKSEETQAEENAPKLTVVEETIEEVPGAEEKSTDAKIEEYLREKGIGLENSAEMPLPEGIRRVAAGTIIAAATGNLVLERDAFIKHDGSEQAFAGMLLTWHPTNVARNRDNLRLKYDGNARVLPLAQQCHPSEIADFIPSLSLEEAVAMGVNRQTYQKYVEAKNRRDAVTEEIPAEEILEENSSEETGTAEN